MDQPLDDLQDGKRDGLAFYSAPIADRARFYKACIGIEISDILVPEKVVKITGQINDHPLLQLYRNLVASIMQEADVKTPVMRDLSKEKIKRQK